MKFSSDLELVVSVGYSTQKMYLCTLKSVLIKDINSHLSRDLTHS